jgi:predicted nucleic-acid-binding protein
LIAVDTNIVVRLLVADDPLQHAASTRLFQEHEVLVPDTVVLETEWVLRFAYRFEPAQVVRAVFEGRKAAEGMLAYLQVW